ncbi:hypothetical protein [Thiomicrorhabdus sp.]|uniref:hypothetical protein n=1 Tax=Thiomicrorhabdus sp. TaxID=2039724 RepID=UPI0029C90E15|nr:hypothetical protein [Thiomicrorhabdus sp.]
MSGANSEMRLAWVDWHNGIDDELVPDVNPSFKRAWAMQQKKVDRAELKVKTMQSAINIAAGQLRLDAKHYNHPALNNIADLLETVKKITEQE